MRSESQLQTTSLERDLHMCSTPQSYSMSLHKLTVDRSQTSETAPTDDKQTRRLYPSLPDIDRFDVYVPQQDIEGRLHTAANCHPEGLLDDTQSHVSAVNSDMRMKAQILILEEQRQELLSINEKWAREYQTMVQYYKEKVRDLKALLQQSSNHFEEALCEEGEMHVTLYKKPKFNTLKNKERKWTGDDDVNSVLLEAEKEANELQAQNKTLTRRGQHQQEEIKRLNKALEEVLQTTQPTGDLWKHQAETYKEDFLKERRDREMLMDKYLELKKRCMKVHNELCVLKAQVTWNWLSQPVLKCSCKNRAKCRNWEVCREPHQVKGPLHS
ncbi:TNFAIP3-interacting protein 1-like [Mastacembelus armatus]|uniref:TNFAIP3-interacting protein 1-like n=1 Tax=Mastacembelus armatus TaxID=205130 RepID=UPI000E458C55|nr:TNFAIP3-interacting protein 1-like [Mastacembelus armatus]